MEQTAGSQRVGETSGTGRQKEHQAAQLGADAVVGVDIDYETVGNNMLMVSASGTAVKLG
jgi:uncharacterized protein YbjQ (UPF0145 family)